MPSPLRRPLALALALLGLALLTTVPTGAAATGPTTCKLTSAETRGLGPSYVTSLKVRGKTCTFGKQLVRAYYKCRAANGPTGRCVKKVLGFSCREQRTGIAVQFDAKVTCSKGSARVLHTYTQNT